MHEEHLSIKIKTLPNEPGVYFFKNNKGEIIYVGKAKSLKARVSSYFKNPNQTAKTTVLVSHIADIETILVDNELEALLLENKLIKKHNPKYNIALKDAKTYAYLMITDEPYPRILSTRKVTKKGTYFGPYTDGGLRRELLQLTVKLFKIRICRKLPKRACLQYHLGLCTAPCIHNVTKEQYAIQVQAAIQFLKGDTKETLTKLEREMQVASKALKFEIAQEKKRQIEAIQIIEEKQKVDLIKAYDQDVIARVESAHEHIQTIVVLSISRGVISGKKRFRLEHEENLIEQFLKAYYETHPIPKEIILSNVFWENEEEKQTYETYFSQKAQRKVELVVPEKGEKKALVALAEKNARDLSENSVLYEMKEKLHLPKIPRSIECFDISNLKDQAIVAAMIQYKDELPNPSEYRKFLIKTTKTQDDFTAMHEAVKRRYLRLKTEEKELPDLIIIDGGPGQLNAACEALRRVGVRIPIIALAKQEEEIYIPNKEYPLQFETQKPMMLFIRRVRDTVHRYVLSYNRKRRSMELKEEFEKIK